jgi:hypothetical protein
MQLRPYSAAVTAVCALAFGLNISGAHAENSATIEAQLAALQTQIDELRTAQNPNAPSAANGFNPAISLILSGGFNESSLNPDNVSLPGFALTGEGGAPAQGFVLGESELTLSASVDDHWYAQTTLAFAEEDGSSEVSVEESFIQSTALPDGLTLKMGRFLSNIGYLNSHHAHTDTFIDRPYVYRTFVDHSYGDDGVQLRYLLPTDTYAEVGGEYLRGDGFPAAGAAHDGRGVYTLFAHVGGDVGYASSWLAGFSQLKARSIGADDGFSGDITLHIADFTWKWAPGGNRQLGGVVARAEWFAEKRDGSWANEDGSAVSAWQTQRSGGYAEASYRWPAGWLAGLRMDSITGDKQAPAPYASGVTSTGMSVVAGLQHTEFSLLRAQLSVFENPAGGKDHGISLQYMVALGAHGAHQF